MLRLRWCVAVCLVWLLACASAQAAPPTASATVTESSLRVTGNIGENVAGVAVSAVLLRPTDPSLGLSSSFVPVAGASATTEADGSWSLSLAPAHAPGASDQLALTYSIGSAPAGTPLPADFSSQPFYFGAYITSDGSTISIAGGACSSFSVLIDGVSHPTGPNGRYCSFTPSTPVNDQDRVQVEYTVTVGSSAGTGDLTSISDAGLVGGTGQSPSCHADLVFRDVACDQLNGGRFAVSLDGGAPVALTPTPFGAAYLGTAHLPGLASGGVLTLDETSPTRTTRHLATLHLASLRIDAVASGTVGGSCQPGEDLIGSTYATPLRSVSGVCAADGSISSSGPLSTAGFGPWFAYQDDDLGEGSTLVELPALASAAPQPNESLPAGGWTAYAALAGPANPLHPGLPVHAPAEVVASTAALDLAIAPAGGGPPALNRQAALGSDAQGAFGSVSIGALPVGRYTAAWTLTDSHGDTQQVAPLFFVQPGPAQAGASGRGGERRVFYKLKCVPKTFHRGGRTFTRESCTVRVRAPWARRVTAVISRHHRVFARGQAAPRAGVAHVSLKDLRRLVPGNYRLTITVAAGRFRRVFRRTVHVQRVRGTIVARL